MEEFWLTKVIYHQLGEHMRDKPIKVLLLEDIPGDPRLIPELMAGAGEGSFEIEWMDRLSAAHDSLSIRGIDVGLLDLSLSNAREFNKFAGAHTRAPGVPMLVLTGLDDNRLALKAVQSGTQDYLVKVTVNTNILVRSLPYAIERKRAEQAEQAATQTVRALIQASPLAIVANDRDANVRIWNPAAERMFGWMEQEVVGRPYPLIPQEKQDEWRRILKQRLRGEVLNGLETCRQRKDGSLVDVAIWTSLLRDANGEISSVMGIIADLTERRCAEERLIQQMRELTLLEERSRLAGEIHDTLAQGFSAIVLQLEAAEEALQKRPSTVLNYLNQAKCLARQSLQEARRSIWDLLPKTLEQRPLETALEDELRRFSATGREKTSLTLQAEKRVLPSGVQTALLRICQEALTNIRKHARATQVHVTLSYQSDAVRLGIQDNGRGFKAKSFKPTPGKNGYGLIAMRERVRPLGGTATIKSQKGEGTVVEVRIPT